MGVTYEKRGEALVMLWWCDNCDIVINEQWLI
jgi:hypothetical protein